MWNLLSVIDSKFHKTHCVLTRLCALFFPLSTKDPCQAARYPWLSPWTNDATAYKLWPFPVHVVN